MARCAESLRPVTQIIPRGCRVEALANHPDWLELVARWHHAECLRQGLDSRYPRRLHRLRDHTLGGASVPQTWLAFSPAQKSPIGCISLVSYQLNTKAGTPSADVPLWLSNLYVEPSFRCQGVGGALIAQVMRFTQSLGHTALWLIAQEHTDYYAKRGWQTMRRASIAKQWVDVMKRDL